VRLVLHSKWRTLAALRSYDMHWPKERGADSDEAFESFTTMYDVRAEFLTSSFVECNFRVTGPRSVPGAVGCRRELRVPGGRRSRLSSARAGGDSMKPSPLTRAAPRRARSVATASASVWNSAARGDALHRNGL
jgi:hypothetical protein